MTPALGIARLRPLLLLVYVAAVIAWFGQSGVSLDKDIIIAVVVGALAVWCIGRPAREMGRLLLEWLPFAGALLLYDAARAGAAALGRPVVVTHQIAIDKALFGGNVPTVWLQSHLLDMNQARWWDVGATLVYVSHFFAVFVVAGWLWTRDRTAWRTFATRFFVLCFTAAVTFAIVPTAPPWAASEFGRIGPVTRSASLGWNALHVREPEVLLQHGRELTNPYAAIPSLHAAWAMLVIITLWPFVSRRFRPLLVAYPLAMAFTLVYTGEHYVIDIFIGWLYVAGAVLLERRIRPLLSRRAVAASGREERGVLDVVGAATGD